MNIFVVSYVLALSDQMFIEDNVFCNKIKFNMRNKKVIWEDLSVWILSYDFIFVSWFLLFMRDVGVMKEFYGPFISKLKCRFEEGLLLNKILMKFYIKLSLFIMKFAENSQIESSTLRTPTRTKSKSNSSSAIHHTK